MGRIKTQAEKDALQQLATPPDFWSVIDAEFQFQIDVCASANNTKCNWYIDAEMNSLGENQAWVGYPNVRWPAGSVMPAVYVTRAWCNPGFARVLPWHKKAYQEAQKSPDAVVVLIGLPGGSQDWWHFAYEHATQIRTLDDRVNYIVPEGMEDKGNSRESWLFIYRRKVVPCPAQIVRDNWRSRLLKTTETNHDL